MITGMEELFFTDKEELRAYQMRQMGLSDWTSGLNFARREGRQEGRQEEKHEVARNALAKGFAIKDISEITGLSPDAIKKL